MFIYEFSCNSEFNSNFNTLLDPSSFLEIKTCQRTVLLSPSTLSLSGLSLSGCSRQFEGAEAYEFLLRFASGLESEIKGETDVFGQVKNAYRNLAETQPSLATSFRTLFLNLFEDTKEIRAEYLRGIGGNTYGALARRLLAPQANDRVVILGAGQLSKSVAPYFAETQLTIFNRSLERLDELKLELFKKGYSNIRFISNEADLKTELHFASTVILATPAKADLDSLVIQCSSPSAKILHLGGQAAEVTHFAASHRKALSLTDLFALEKEQDLFREKQIKQAMDACHSRSILRSMARSIHIPHGWEDLALFY